MQEDEDVQLMLAFQQGDYDAFGTLVERHQPRLIRYFLAQAQDRQLAEDCAQEVWRKVFLSRDSYQPRLLRYFLAQAQDRQLAEDCAQEVWRKVFLSRDGY